MKGTPFGKNNIDVLLSEINQMFQGTENCIQTFEYPKCVCFLFSKALNTL